MRKPDTHSSLTDMLERTAAFYRRELWTNQQSYVEIWLEKDALAGVLWEVTSEYDVPLMVTRGYPSVTFLHSAGEHIETIEKPTFLYYFGDHDPSGVDITRAVRDGIAEFTGGAEFCVERVAVTTAQIEALSLPTRPTKRTDSRARSFRGESVEVDAIPPAELRRIASNCIEQHIDQRALAETRRIEQRERKTLEDIATEYPL